MITLKDIASRAGVSTVTVSNVINGNHKKVSMETIEKVEAIIEELNYVPNATARSLARRESKIIGVVIPYIGKENHFLKSPYNAEILGVLERLIREEGYFLMVRCVNSCLEILPTLLTWNVDGMIFIGAFKDEVIKIKNRVKVPMIFMDTYFEDLQLVNVGVDDYKGEYLATKYLLMRGHEKIALAGPDIHSQGVVRERYCGYKDAMEENGYQIEDCSIYYAPTSYEDGVKLGKKIAFEKERCTAIVSMSDILALGIMEGLRVSGLSVPNDVSIIGFDNLPECKYPNPQLTSVSQNIEKKANIVAKYLFEMIREKKEMTMDIKIDVEICERQSVKSL